MKKCIALLLCVCLFLPLFGCSEKQEAAQTIRLICCTEYVPSYILADYENRNNIQIIVDRVETEEEITEKIKSDPTGYDLVIASDYTINELRLSNLLYPMDRAEIPNSKNLDKVYSNLYFDPHDKYTIPLNVAAILMAYNQETCPIPIKSYADLTNPALKEEIVFHNNSNVIVGICNMMLGVDPTSIEQKDALPDILSKLAANTHSLQNLTPQNALIAEEASVGVMFNVSIGTALDQNKNIKLVYPEEGFILAADAIAYCNMDAPSKATTDFVNYLLSDMANALIIENLNGCSTLVTAKTKMDTHYIENEGYTLDPSQIKNSKFFCEITPEIQRSFDRMYVRAFRDHLLKLQEQEAAAEEDN